MSKLLFVHRRVHQSFLDTILRLEARTVPAGQKRAPSVVSENTPTDVKEKTREALLAYCEKDTEAMVRVFDVLCSMES